MSNYQKFLEKAEAARNGKAVSVPIHLNRMSDHLSIQQARYTLLAGGTGSGKTSFLDDTYILNPYMHLAKLPDTEVKLKVLYASMERPENDKLAKWACWKLFKDKRLKISSADLLGYTKNRVSDEIWNLVTKQRDWADSMLDFVDLKCFTMSPGQFKKIVLDYAYENGTLLMTDSEGLSLNNGPYIKSFKPSATKEDSTGRRRQFVEYNLKGKTYVLYQNDKLYVPNNSNEIVMVIADHVGKFKGTGSKKERIDNVSQAMADFRDIFGYNVIAVSQFNRNIADSARMKMAKGDLSPILEDIKETGNTQEDADLVISLFNPYRYKAYDANGEYLGYNIATGMHTPNDFNRFRTVSILKNSYGLDDITYGMIFLGEVGVFQTMPKPEEAGKIQAIYNGIKNGTI